MGFDRICRRISICRGPHNYPFFLCAGAVVCLCRRVRVFGVANTGIGASLNRTEGDGTIHWGGGNGVCLPLHRPALFFSRLESFIGAKSSDRRSTKTTSRQRLYFRKINCYLSAHWMIKFMNKQSQSLWREPLNGPRALLLWISIVSAAAFLFAAALITTLYFFAPAMLFACANGYGYLVWQIPGLVPALIGLRAVALFIGAVAMAFAIRHIIQRFFFRGSNPSPVQKGP